MAEGSSTSGESWESWLGGWVQAAKEKSTTALEMVKKDLAEFTCTMHKDTEEVVEKTRESLKKENSAHAADKVRAGLSSFLGNISKALVIPPDDDYVPMKVAADGSGLYDRGKARLHAIQLDASTYVDPPRGPPEQFEMWLENFNMEEHKGEISELLVSKVEVRALYTKLVPNEVSHAEFWQRYFYRVHQLQCDEARKKALMQRADETKKDSFTWDDDDDDWSGAEDDDGNHSDWEKMPRPPQSYAAKLSTEASQKQTSSSTAPKMASEKGQVNVQNSNFTPSQDSAANPVAKPVKNVPSEEAGGQETDSRQMAVLETSMSAFAAGTNDLQSFPEKPDLGIEKAKPEGSEDMQNASGQSSGSLVQKLSSDLWSLHIPSDTASASHSGEDEYGSVETANLEAGSPSDVYRQGEEANRTQGSLQSCAASGGDISPSLSTEPEVTSADGACGASDMGPAPVIPQPLQPVAEPSPDISAAGIEVAEEPTNVPHQGQDALLQGFGSSFGSPQIPANQVPVASTVSAPITPPPVQNLDSLTLPHEKAESISEISTNENDSGTITRDKASEVMAASQQTASQATEIPASGDAKPSSAEVVQAPEHEISALSAKSAEEGEGKEIGMRVKGDMVVVGDRDSPASSDSSDHKEIDDDWEQDFDIEVTEEDLKAAEDIAKRLGENLSADDDDWENWE